LLGVNIGQTLRNSVEKFYKKLILKLILTHKQLKMKKLLFLLVLSIVPNAFADWEEIVDDLIEKEQEQEIKIINESFQIEQFTTKEDFEEFLSNKLYDKIIDYCKNYYYYPIRWMYRPFKGRVLEKSLDIQVQSLKEETLGDIKENSFDDQLDY